MTDIKTKIELGGFPQKIHIRTDDESKPVLLFLHGGPGVCNRNTILQNHADLLDTFTVATWDQRGSGGSYKGLDPNTLTIERLTDDAAELVEWLCRRFAKDKIFIIGGSWGSLLGTWLSVRYPEHIAAFVGFGQVVNIELNEKLSWEFTLDAAKKAGDEKAVETLEEVGPPVMGCYKGGIYEGMMKQRNIMMKYGGYSQAAEKRSYWDAFVKPVLLSGEFSLSDMYGLAVGHKLVLEKMWEEIGTTDFNKTCTEFKVPVYIFDGRLDNNTPSALVQDWFDSIKAPDKHLEWFENSGHNPMGDEGEKFKTLLREKLLAVKARESCII